MTDWIGQFCSTTIYFLHIMAATLETLEDLFALRLKDLYSAENQLVKALPQMAIAANDETLRQSFETHLAETQQQVARLEQIGQSMDLELGGHTCAAMKGLVTEGQETMSKNASDEVMDAALIAAAQRIEHYGIAGYGTAANYAESLGYSEAATLLRQTLEEEQCTDTKLNDLAKSSINQKAL